MNKKYKKSIYSKKILNIFFRFKNQFFLTNLYLIERKNIRSIICRN
jgi:hypothetical protein